MGYNDWSDDDYLSRERRRRSTGKSSFGYTDEEMSHVRPEERRCHQKMDPRNATRESRDSTTHPKSLAINVVFDHTGSMQRIPRILQKKLTSLMGLLLQKGYTKHPQVLFGAVGDAVYDRAPLQTGQFESGIEMDNDLGHLLLEGGGGPMGSESYELAIYFAARHASIDCWEKRKKKGYLFLIGDEMPYPEVKAREVQEIIGDKLNRNIPIKEMVTEAKEKYHIFYLIPTSASWGKNPKVAGKWASLLGQDCVLQLDYPEAISETVALLIGITEGKITLKEGLKDLKEMGLTAKVIKSIAGSLASVPCNKEKGSTKGKTGTGKAAGKIGRL